MANGAILLSAGGTGGHLFPAESLAHELKRRGWSVHLATDDRASRYAGSFPAEAIHPITSATPGSKNPAVLARTMMALWKGFREASVVLQKLKPSAVVGFGGYPTLPPLFAATRRGIPTIIHEQNAVMGRANRALAPRVTLIAGGFLPAGGGRHAAKTLVTGNPVRPAVLDAARTPYDAPRAGGEFRMLVFGGSQGALYFSEAMPAAIALLNPGQRSRLNLVQQARPEDEEKLKAAYAKMAVRAKVAPFFDDLAQRMAKAHLVVSRAGASTVSEIGIIGRPAILVPYPYALDHDQAANAAALAAAGGAEVHKQADLPPETLASVIAAMMEGPERLGVMAAAARATGRPDATRLLADAVEAIAAGKSAFAPPEENLQ